MVIDPSRALLLALLALAGCGARTGLEVERCGDAGDRACDHPCGEGTQTCEDGVWSDCAPVITERACEDACGEGTQTCEPGGWSECETPEVVRECTTPCAEGIETCTDGRWTECSFPEPVAPVLAVRVRDFRDSHPDFERDQQGSDRGIVADELGDDDLPVYTGESRTTSGQEAFDQWYRDVDGVNLGTGFELPLVAEAEIPNRFVFDDEEFFPIDGMLFGNEGRAHNYHFTLAASTEFVYSGGEEFVFRGDDDVFVFINRRLAIDLGGVHPRQSQSVNIDDRAEALGLEVGGRYPLHLFFAERHTFNSSFRIETTLSDPVIRCE